MEEPFASLAALSGSICRAILAQPETDWFRSLAREFGQDLERDGLLPPALFRNREPCQECALRLRQKGNDLALPELENDKRLARDGEL